MNTKLIATGAACAFAAGALAIPAFAATKTVRVEDNKFVSAKVTVSKGTTVSWVWKGQAPHDVAVTKGPVKFKSTVKTKGTFKKKMTRKGTYTIVCNIHPPSMKMKLTVK